MGAPGEDLAERGVIYPGAGYVLSGSVTGGGVVWFRVVKHVGVNDKYGGGKGRRLPM